MTLPAAPQATALVQAPPPKPKFEFTTPLDDKDLNVLLYGEFGVGKTSLAATAVDVPEMQDVLYVACEAGEKVLRPFAARGHLTVVRVGQYSTVARIYEWLVLHCRYRDAGDMERLAQLESVITGVIPTTPKLFRTVILDSLTEIQVLLMYQLMGIEIGRSRLDLPPDSPEFKEWGQSSEMIKFLIRSFRDLGLNVIIVCSMEEKEDEKKRQLKRLLLPGKLATSVQGFLDVVGFLEKAKTDAGFAWRLHLTSGQTFHAKNRFGPTAPPHLDAPTMAQLFALNNLAPKESPTNASAPTNTTASSSARPTSAASAPRGPIRVGVGDRGPVRTAGR